ncbi:MAG TPA: molybdopterin molybdenumtransferase MoeA, partial [bacterium]|nr:molybdopterin molybdenumtransferase MoeA [bacterium]
MLTIDEAVKNILETVKPLGSETVGILESYGRIIAEEVRADSDVPFCDNSAMDGFAVIAEDVKAASEEKPVELKILEKIQAGRVAEHKVEKGTAVRIMTGAPIPQGADAVVMVEYTETRDDRAFIKAPVEKGANIR